jgi:hypothetical protein
MVIGWMEDVGSIPGSNMDFFPVQDVWNPPTPYLVEIGAKRPERKPGY